jgi:hypothetical protein
MKKERCHRYNELFQRLVRITLVFRAEHINHLFNKVSHFIDGKLKNITFILEQMDLNNIRR